MICLGHILSDSNHVKFNKVLIFNVDDSIFGIIVDSVENIIEVPVRNIFSIPWAVGGSAFHCFDEIVNWEGTYKLSLSPASIYNKLYLNHNTDRNIDLLHESNCLPIKFSISDKMRKKILIFSTADEELIVYGLSITQIPQVLQLTSILPIPGSEIYIAGVVEWRGIILPILDLSLYIEGRKTEIRGNDRILVVRLVSLPLYIGIVIRPQIFIQDIPIKQHLYQDDKGFELNPTISQYKLRDQTLVIPDIDKIIIKEDRILT